MKHIKTFESFLNESNTKSLEVNEGGGTLKIEKEKDGKYYWTFTFKSGKVEKWANGFDTSAEAQKDFMYRSKYLKESLDEAKKMKGFVKVKIGDKAEDYEDREWTVVAKGLGREYDI